MALFWAEFLYMTLILTLFYSQFRKNMVNICSGSYCYSELLTEIVLGEHCYGPNASSAALLWVTC